MELEASRSTEKHPVHFGFQQFQRLKWKRLWKSFIPISQTHNISTLNGCWTYLQHSIYIFPSFHLNVLLKKQVLYSILYLKRWTRFLRMNRLLLHTLQPSRGLKLSAKNILLSALLRYSVSPEISILCPLKNTVF